MRDNVASGFDSHSITISSDTLGSITVAGDGTGNRSISFRYYCCWRYLGSIFDMVLTTVSAYAAALASDAQTTSQSIILYLL